MPYTKQNLAAGDVLTETNVDAFDDGLYEAYLAMENRQPTGAAFPFYKVGTKPAVGRLFTEASYLTHGSKTSDGYWNFGDSAAWNSNKPGLPETAIIASTTSLSEVTIIDKLFILPATLATTLTKIEGVICIDVRADSGANDALLTDVELVLWKIPASGGGSPTILSTDSVLASTQTVMGDAWQRKLVEVSLDYGAGYSFAAGLYAERIGIGIKTKGYLSGVSGTAFHGIGIQPADDGVNDNRAGRRTTLGFYFS